MAKKQMLSQEQDRAANPDENVWVQANAGTGKTSVLVQRLLRILFRSNNWLSENNKPNGILCLTYTNAGASEMRNRILAALRGWANSTDDELIEMLNGITINNNPDISDLQRARNIFYYYIDNPDVLKIKTIHGFCEEILRRFPIEAGISPSWNLVSDSNQKILLTDTFHKLINSPILTNINSDIDNTRITTAFSHIVERVSEQSFDELLGILTSQYKHFFKVPDISRYREYFINTTRYFLDLDSPIQELIPDEKLQKIIELVENEIKTSKKPGGYLVDIVNMTKQYIDKTINFEKYKTAYLTASNTKIANVAKKDFLVEEQDRVYKLNQRQLDEQAFADTVALFDLSAAFTMKYKELKASRSVLDFDDLILYTRKLFSKPQVMGWVLSQLDLSLGHILVDEAQDTSPEQWEILRMLAGDFFTDGDTAQKTHSLFVVGDTKQSIYGFQGADPLAFSQSKDEIANQIKNNLRVISEIPLTQSFRSTSAILSVVDIFFGNPQVQKISGFINNNHKCFRQDSYGLVEIHSLFTKESN